MGLLFPRPARTFLVIAVGLSQVGEFSFILGQGGLSLNLLDTNQYSLILAASLISITINPFMYKLIPVLEKTLRRLPGFWQKLESNRSLAEVKKENLKDHVVIIGFGRVGKHLVNVLESLHIPLLVIETDAERCEALNMRKIPTLYGDASNSEVITHAHLDQARALVTTVPDETTSLMIVTSARDLNPGMPIIARVMTEQGVRTLEKSGANHVVHPELEGGLEVVNHTLLSLGFPLREVHAYTDAVRRDRYDINITTVDEQRSLHGLLNSFGGIEIVWLQLSDTSALIGQSLAEANIRTKSGASVVALVRSKQLFPNPKSGTVFQAGDRIGVIGEQDQIEVARTLVGG
jgi:CPA2 family monovalent cation:H+ antiporter-2